MNPRTSPDLREDRSSGEMIPAAALPGSRRDRTRAADVAAAFLLAIGAALENRSREHRTSSAVVTAVPIVLVNIVAFYGQYDYLTHSLAAPRAITTIMAAALESIAVYLAYQAHVALIADDSALRLRLGAYSVALGIAVLNYSHWMRPHWRPTATAVAFALCSAISPALWSVHSRRSSRTILKARELIEPHAVRLGATRWFWHLARSVHVTYLATWIGENRPAEAIRLIEKPAQVRTGRGSRGKAAQPPATPKTPPPVTGPREPRRDTPSVPRVKAQGTGLAAARNDAERTLVAELVSRELTGADGQLPKARSLADDERLSGSFSTRRRAAARVLALAGAAMNGSAHERVNGS
jgi:hypothetical protein